MQVGQDQTGMITMNQCLKSFCDKVLIDNDTAITYTSNPEELEKMLGVARKRK